MFIFLALFGGFSSETILEQIKSPDGMHCAFLIESNQGALGGAHLVYVKRTDEDKILISGYLRKTSEKINLWSGGWYNYPENIIWKDNDTLCIDDKIYELNF